jgi:hypothetical protein
MVSTLPPGWIDPGPETTLKVTANPELDEADSVIGPCPYATGDAGAEKLMVCGAELMVRGTVVFTPWKLLSPLYATFTV